MAEESYSGSMHNCERAVDRRHATWQVKSILFLQIFYENITIEWLEVEWAMTFFILRLKR